MASFAEFLRWPDREVVILAELTPSLALSGWTAVGGATPNVYQIALPRLIQTDRLAGGVYRRCAGVRENTTDLTERASVAAVNANASSWYWDEAAEVLYVHTSTGSDPDLFTVYHALVTFYVATTGIVLNRTDGDDDTGIYHWPWLSGDVPKLLSEVEDVLSGQKNTLTGDIALTNAHGCFNTIIAPDGPYTWKNKRVRLYVGGAYNGQALLRSQYAPLGTLKVEDVTADELRCIFKLARLTRATERTLPVTPYFESSYPNLGEGVKGTKKWIGYGRATIPPDLTDTSGLGVWTLADAAYQTLFAVHGVNAIAKATGVRTALALATDYTVDLTACTVTIVNATYAWQNYTLEVDVTGKPDGAGSYLQTFGAIVPDLLQTFLQVSASEIDTAAFAAAVADAPEELAVWVKEPRTLASILSTNEPGFPSLEKSVNGTVQQTLEGVWTGWIWDSSYDPDTIIRLSKEDFAAFTHDPKVEAVYTTVHAHYRRDYSRGEWQIESDTDSRAAALSETNEALDVFTYLRGVSDALRLAQRYLVLSTVIATEIEFVERGARLAQSLAGDKVLVTFDPAPAAAGLFSSEPMEIIRLEVSYAPELRVSGRLGNLKGIGKKIGRWTESTAPAWASATADDKARSGYWGDTAGFVDPADAATKDCRIWF